MKRDRRTTGIVRLATAAACILPAGTAAAAEGQLVLLPDPLLLPVLVVLFGLLVWPVNALILKPIFRVLDQRDEKIAGTRRQAERLAAETETTLARYEESVRDVRAEAERDRKATLDRARSDGASTTTAARAEAEDQVTRARREVAAALDDARGALKTESVALAREIASRALGRELS